MSVVEVVQISDLHLTDGAGELSFLGRDSDASLTDVLDAIGRRTARPDVVVATGDLADQAGADAYRRLAEALGGLVAPVYCLAGNHDGQAMLESQLPRPGVHVEPATRVGPWLFVFVDSNARGRARDPEGIWRDRDDRYVAADHGALTPEELARVRSILTTAGGAHVLLWLHHPPVRPVGSGEFDPDYSEDLRGLVRDFPQVRGLACGHLHAGFEGTFEGRAVFGCPSTSINVDYRYHHFDPPGYRWFRLHPDGKVETGVEDLEARYPEDRRRPVPPPLIELMLGDITPLELTALSDEQFEARYGVGRTGRPS